MCELTWTSRQILTQSITPSVTPSVSAPSFCAWLNDYGKCKEIVVKLILSTSLD